MRQINAKPIMNHVGKAYTENTFSFACPNMADHQEYLGIYGLIVDLAGENKTQTGRLRC